MKVVILDGFDFVFEVDLPPHDGSDESFDVRGDALMAELERRAKEDPEWFPGYKENGYVRSHYVDKVTPLPTGAELWGLGT